MLAGETVESQEEKSQEELTTEAQIKELIKKYKMARKWFIELLAVFGLKPDFLGSPPQTPTLQANFSACPAMSSADRPLSLTTILGYIPHETSAFLPIYRQLIIFSYLRERYEPFGLTYVRRLWIDCRTSSLPLFSSHCGGSRGGYTRWYLLVLL